MGCSTTLTLPSDYGYVILAATLLTVVTRWHNVRDYNSRIARDPNAASAPVAETRESKEISLFFKRFSRSQVSILEHEPTILAYLLWLGTMYPIRSAGFLLGWCGARVLYALGYVKDPQKFIGKGQWLGTFFWGTEFFLQIRAFWFAYQTLQSCRR